MASTALVTDQTTIPTGTASTTSALGSEQVTSPQADRASLSVAAAPLPLATASGNNLNAPASQSNPKMSQSQPSSQQSFAAAKPSSSQRLGGGESCLQRLVANLTLWSEFGISELA